MSRLISIAETAQWLQKRDDFLIITHRRPDGDTLGCAGALAQGLREIGKTAYVLYNPEVTPRYTRCVEDCWAADDYTPKTIIVVDTASIDLFTKNALAYKDNISLCIDHHSSNTKYADFVCLDSTYASCGEIVYEILMSISKKISETTAERLYVAVSTDTGCFSFGNTTSNTLSVAARLVDAGAPIKYLNKILFRTKTMGRVKIEGLINTGMEFHFDGKVAIVAITREMMELSDADEDDLDDIATIAGSIEGVGIGITIRELSSINDCKISVRAMPQYNANEICKRFGGGGHQSAAGASIKKTITEVKTALLEALKDFVK